MSRIIGINGSPRKDRNSARLLDSALSGAKDSGAEVRRIDLYDLSYTGCRSCFACKLLGSPTFGKYHGEILTADNRTQYLIPRGFAHGFLVLSDEAEFCYKCDDFYHPDDEGGLAWNDPEIGINWPGVEGAYPGNASAAAYTLEGRPLILAPKDQNWKTLRETFTF